MSQYVMFCVGKLTLEELRCWSPDLGGSEIKEDHCRAWYLSCGEWENISLPYLLLSVLYANIHIPLITCVNMYRIIIVLVSLGRAVQAFSCVLKSRSSIHGFPEVPYLFLLTSTEKKDDFLQPVHILKNFLACFFSDKLLLQLCLYMLS